MQIVVKVVPGAKKNLVRKEGDGLKVYLNAPALEGKANKALTDVLAHYYGVRKRQIAIVRGLKSRQKTVIIEDI